MIHTQPKFGCGKVGMILKQTFSNSESAKKNRERKRRFGGLVIWDSKKWGTMINGDKGLEAAPPRYFGNSKLMAKLRKRKENKLKRWT